MIKTISATRARKDLFKLIRFAGNPGNRVRITLRNAPHVMMLSANEFDEWVERIARRRK
jgi:prevent-host-death family protein